MMIAENKAAEDTFREKNIIIGTAGHIDHGKTTLISALTGTDTDRLKEEQERGISIDLGFTGLELTESIKAGIVDVPGHEKFVKNMLAGAGGVDLALLVIAADEGIMAQTREHLAILELLQVEYGVVVITKIDLVEEDWLELVIEDCREQLEDTFLAEAPIVTVSGTTGENLPELKETLARVAMQIPGKDKDANPYLPVDRVFTLSGFGTVVTGTLVRGSLNKGQTIMIYPGKEEARIRSLQVHNDQREEVFPGERVGINLAGIDLEQIERGDVLAEPESLLTTSRLDARVKLLSSAPLVLEQGTRIRFHIGAREVLGRVYMIDKEEVLPGEKALVQYRLEEEVVSRYLENYVIRRYSPMITIGGGKIIENSPPRRKMKDKEVIRELEIKENGTPDERILLTLELAARPLKLPALIARTNLSEKELREILTQLENADKVIELARYQKPSWLAKKTHCQLVDEIKEIISDYHKSYPLRPGIGKEELRSRLEVKLVNTELNQLLEDLAAAAVIKEQENYVALPDFEVEFTGKMAELKRELLTLYKRDLFSPPNLAELPEIIFKEQNFSKELKEENILEEIVLALERQGQLVRITEELYFATEALKKAEELLLNYFSGQDSIELSDFRDLLDSSRKYALPLLEYFDEQNLTRREGDQRYPGKVLADKL